MVPVARLVLLFISWAMMCFASMAQTDAEFEAVRKKAVESLQSGQGGASLAFKSTPWRVQSEKSKLDDSTTVYLATRSLDTHANRYGEQKPLHLTIACRENSTNVYIDFAEHFMADIQGKGKVSYRVDAKPAKARNFRESNDHSVLGLWGGARSIPWLKELFGGKRLYVRATPFSESEVDGEFSIEGLEGVIVPLRTACGW